MTRPCFPAYVQVFSALIVIIAGAFVITIIYKSVTHTQTWELEGARGGQEKGGRGSSPPVLSGRRDGLRWTDTSSRPEDPAHFPELLIKSLQV